MSIARHHAEWLSLLEVSGPFLSMPVLIQVFPQGLDAHDTETMAQVRLAYDEWNDAEGDPAIHAAWMRFIRETALEWPTELWREGQGISPGLEYRLPAHGETLRPDGVLIDPKTDTPVLLWNAYAPKQSLEKALAGHPWHASPATRMAELLRATDVRLGLISNGETWMLVYAPAAPGEPISFVSWYSALWIEERPTWRAFNSLLGGERFFAVRDDDTLPRLFERSAENQQEVTDQLGLQVRRAVEVLVQTFDREDQDTGGTLLTGLSPRQIYEAALAVMMRLVFLFCAEERGMLPLDDALYASNYAVSTLRASLREDADARGEEVLERRYDAWCRLLATFRAVHGGVAHDRLNLIPYGGRLFDPDRYPFLEGRAPGSDWHRDKALPLPVDNRTVLHLLEALQVLQVRVPGGGSEARVLSFRALDIEQIGHVYEGLLDKTAKRANGPVLSLKGPGEPEIELDELERLAEDGKALFSTLKDQTGRTLKALETDLMRTVGLEEIGPLRRVCGDEELLARVMPFAFLVRADSFGLPVVVRPGSLFVTQGSDRRSSGTHYTPRSLTEPLVAKTLDPLLYRGFADGVAASPETLKSPREILDLKVCDPACGSAGVLVQACRYLADRLVEAWDKAEREHDGNGTLFLPYAETVTIEGGWGPLPKGADERALEARRLVADRCLFGVDRDPLAVEMAQLSLWLVTMQRNRPFSFLEHAIRQGDSLVGVDLDQMRSQSMTRQREGSLAQVNMRNAINAANAHRKRIQKLHDDEGAQRAELRAAEKAIEKTRLFADAIIAPSFLKLKPKERADKRHSFWQRAINSQLTESWAAELRTDLDIAYDEVRPFHWPLEFPEVFFREDDATEGDKLAAGGGFDAIVGNPPFVGGQRITGALGVPYRDYLIESLAREKKGSADLAAYFYLRAFDLLRPGGCYGLIATNTIAQGDTREVGLDQLVGAGATIYDANPSQKWPGVAALEVAIVRIRKGDWNTTRQLAGKEVEAITPYLSAPGSVDGNPRRLAANTGQSFQGSIVLGMGFVLEPEAALALIDKDPKNRDVLFPYLNGDDLNSRPDQSPSRWVINFRDWPLNHETAPLGYSGPVAADYPDCLKIIEELVKPERDRLATGDATAKDRARRWWQFGRPTMALYSSIVGLPEVLVCPIFTKFLSFVWVPDGFVYMNKLYVFAIKGAGAFAFLQSSMHEEWARRYSGTLETRLQYASTDCFETFPFVRLDVNAEQDLQEISERYSALRQGICRERQLGLTDTYNLFHDPITEGDEPTQKQPGPFDDIRRLRALHLQMDEAVARAYGWDDLALGHGFHETAQGIRFTLSEAARREVLDRLLALNHARYAEEVKNGLHDKKAPKPKAAKSGAKSATKAAKDKPATSGRLF